MLKALVLSQRRSGSTFGVKTIQTALGLCSDKSNNSRSIIPYEKCDDLLKANYVTLRWKLWRNRINILKIEEPYSHQELVEHLLGIFPRVKAITTIRNIQSMIASRMILKQAWGKSTTAEKIIEEWVDHYHFLENFMTTYPGKLFVIDIDRPQLFRVADFCEFLNVDLTPEFEVYSDKFVPVNTLESQVRKHKVSVDNEDMGRVLLRKDLIEIFPELTKYEFLYGQLSKLNHRSSRPV
jgi:hypothetical protein